MTQQSLEAWARRQFREVEESGACASRIQLMTSHDGTIWETWEKPFPDPGQWASDVEAYLDTLAGEWPNRGVAVVFVSFDHEGQIRAQLQRTVQGKRIGGKLGAGGDSVALTQALENLTNTMERTLRLANSQLDHSRKLQEQQAKTIEIQTTYIQLIRERDALTGSGEAALDKMLAEGMEQFPKLLSLWLENKQANGKV